MELGISAAKPRLSELVAAAQRGERVVITKRGEPAVELVARPKQQEKPQGDFFARVKEARERLGISRCHRMKRGSSERPCSIRL